MPEEERQIEIISFRIYYMPCFGSDKSIQICHPILFTLHRVPGGVKLPWFSSSVEGPVRQDTNELSSALSRGDPRDIMTKTFHESHSRVVVGILKNNLVWYQLVVQTRLG